MFSWCHNLSFRYSVLPFKLALKDLPKFPPLGKNMQPDLQDQTTNSSTCGVFHLDLPGITFMSLHQPSGPPRSLSACPPSLCPLHTASHVVLLLSVSIRRLSSGALGDFPSRVYDMFLGFVVYVSKYYLDVWFMFMSTHVSIYQNSSLLRLHILHA